MLEQRVPDSASVSVSVHGEGGSRAALSFRRPCLVERRTAASGLRRYQQYCVRVCPSQQEKL
jgi:hypothetical protein